MITSRNILYELDMTQIPTKNTDDNEEVVYLMIFGYSISVFREIYFFWKKKLNNDLKFFQFIKIKKFKKLE